MICIGIPYNSGRYPVLSVINDLKNKWYKHPSSYYLRKRMEFKQQSYARSALDEICFYLTEHKNENPITAVENFRYMVDCFACESKNSETNFMFSVYYDVTSDVLDALLEIN